MPNASRKAPEPATRRKLRLLGPNDTVVIRTALGGWLDSDGIATPAPPDEAAGRLYIRNNCFNLPSESYDSIKRHAAALSKMGFGGRWITEQLMRVCGHWATADRAMPRKMREAVWYACRFVDEFKDLHDDAPRADDASRFAAKDIDYFDKLPEVEWLLDGVIAEGSLFVIYGKEKAGKTFFTMSMAMSMAARRPFCGLKTKYSRVLYVIAEGDDKEFGNRMNAWLASHPRQQQDEVRQYLQSNFKVVTVPVMVNTEEQVRALVAANPGEWDLVVLDTYMRNTSGNINDPKDSVAFVRGCDLIRELTGAAVAVLHHQGKEEKRGMFGSMLLGGACDGAAVIIRKGDERIFRMKLMRNGDDSQSDIIYSLEKQFRGYTDDDQEIHSVAVKFKCRRSKHASGDDLDRSDLVLTLIHNDRPKTIEELADLLGKTSRTVKRDLAKLRNEKLLGSGLSLTPKGKLRAETVESDADDGVED